MFDLDMEFSKIIHKYLTVEYKENKRDLIYGKVYKILRSKCFKKNIAMWGVGDLNNPEETYVSKFLNVFADSLQNTKCLVDMRREIEGKELLGLPIVLPDKMFKYNVDVILVTSYRSRKYIVKEIQAQYPNIPYLDVYEELEKMGFNVDADIFAEDDTQGLRTGWPLERKSCSPLRPVRQCRVWGQPPGSDVHSSTGGFVPAAGRCCLA